MSQHNKLKLNEEELKIVSEQVCKVSHGLIKRMLKRLKISYRVPTNKISKLQQDLALQVSDFIIKIQTQIFQIEQLKKFGQQISQVVIINSDQTSLVFDTNSKTYAPKGQLQIPIKKHNNEKDRYTIWLAITNNGQKLKPFVIAKGQKEVKNFFKDQLSMSTNKKGWATQEQVLSFMKYRILNHPRADNQVILHLLDSFACHKSQMTKDFLEEEINKNQLTDKIFTEYLPPGFTPYLQPLDVSINKTFKSLIQKELTDWWEKIGSEQSNLTPSGYYKGPSHFYKQQFIVNAWNKVPEQQIIESFQICGYGKQKKELHNQINKEEILKLIQDKWETFMQNLKSSKEGDEGYELNQQIQEDYKNEYYPMQPGEIQQLSESSDSSESQSQDDSNDEQINNKRPIYSQKDNKDIPIQKQQIIYQDTQDLEYKFTQNWLSSSDDDKQIKVLNKTTKKAQKKIQQQQNKAQKSAAVFFKPISKEEKKQQLEQQHKDYLEEKEQKKFVEDQLLLIEQKQQKEKPRLRKKKKVDYAEDSFISDKIDSSSDEYKDLNSQELKDKLIDLQHESSDD